MSFGLDYSALYQGATHSLGEDQAASALLRFSGIWTLLGRESGNTGSLIFKVEHRHRLGTDVTPQNLGFEACYVGLTGTQFNQFRNHSWGVTNLYWQQKLFKGRLLFVAGQVDVTDYVDIYGLTNPWTAFSNLAFLTDPTIPAPDPGLGASVGAMASENMYVVVGLADTNGDPTEPGEWFDKSPNDARDRYGPTWFRNSVISNVIWYFGIPILFLLWVFVRS